MLSTLIALVCLAAIVAAWDAARRYFDMKRFNQTALDHLATVEREQEKLASQVQALAGKLNMATATGVTRLNRAGGR